MIGPYCAPACKLVVIVNRPGLIRSVEIALGLVHVGAGQRGSQSLQTQSIGRQRGGIRLHPNGRALPSADAHQTYAFELGNSLRHARFRQLFHFRQRHRVRRNGQRQNRRVGGIRLAVNRRNREIGGKKSGGCIDGGLHFLLGDIDAEIERKLQRDQRTAKRTDRRHLRQSGHLAELLLERRRDRRRHYLRACARVERLDLHGGIIHLRQRRNRQLPESDVMPTSTTPAIISDVATGLRMKMRDGLTAESPPPCPFLPPPFLPPALLAAASAAAGGGVIARRIVQLSGFPHSHRGAFDQPVGAIDHHAVAVRDAAENVG